MQDFADIIALLKRYLSDKINSDLKTKTVFLTGPRQAGKTYLAKSLLKDFSGPQYLNCDNLADSNIIN